MPEFPRSRPDSQSRRFRGDVDADSRRAPLRRARLIEVFPKLGEDAADERGVAEVGEGIGDGVVVAQIEQRGELVLVELAHAFADVVREHEVEEGLLFIRELAVTKLIMRAALTDLGKAVRLEERDHLPRA